MPRVTKKGLIGESFLSMSRRIIEEKVLLGYHGGMDIRFVLVAPAVAGNVGASARALKTMGFRGLRLVGSELHRQEEALWTAHGSRDILENAEVFASLREALADRDFVIATTARRRGLRHEYHPAGTLEEMIRRKGGAALRPALVFGPEESGLSNADLQLCDCLSSIPLAAPQPSLNLSQAVMLYAYLLSPLAPYPGREPGTQLPARATGSRLRPRGPGTALPARAAGSRLTSRGPGTALPARGPEADFPAPEDPAELREDGGESFRALKDRAAALLRRLSPPAEDQVGRRLLERLAALDGEDIKLLHSLCARLEKALDERGFPDSAPPVRRSR